MDIKKFIALNSIMCVGIAFLYVMLHEGGHSLVAVFCGAQITRFSILDAEISYSGGVFSSVSLALLNAAGALLPAIVAIILSFFYKKNIQNPLYKTAYYIFFVCVIFSLLPWFIYPVFSINDSTDDITRFIDTSAFSPILTAFLSALLIGILVFAGIKSGIFAQMGNVRHLITKKDKKKR
ncbi:MAG: M50 family metallopeptidase [Flavobacteriales bacterium]|nr:M50 family metallopeptidase [Flavobacteriales bacterium]